MLWLTETSQTFKVRWIFDAQWFRPLMLERMVNSKEESGHRNCFQSKHQHHHHLRPMDTTNSYFWESRKSTSPLSFHPLWALVRRLGSCPETCLPHPIRPLQGKDQTVMFSCSVKNCGVNLTAGYPTIMLLCTRHSRKVSCFLDAHVCVLPDLSRSCFSA